MDGLLHHETDLNIEEHYTDTAGYTDQIFGLTHLLVFKFAPRIRDLSDSKLFTIDKASEYPKLEAILRGQINTKVIEENYEDVLRLAHTNSLSIPYYEEIRFLFKTKQLSYSLT